MKEAIQDDFRQWYMEYKRAQDKPTTAASSKDAKKKGGDKKDAKKDGKKDGKKGKDEPEEEEETNQFKYDQSEYIGQIGSEQAEYNAKWKHKDESDNFAQKHDQEIIKADKRREVEAEIKKDVFEILQDELKNLKLAVEREKNAKGKKGKGKGKKGKILAWREKGKKGKKEKDLTANRTTESLVEELVQTGLLQKVFRLHAYM
eukprot:jgi/Hompol1/239/HPOL_000388-RA